MVENGNVLELLAWLASEIMVVVDVAFAEKEVEAMMGIF